MIPDNAGEFDLELLKELISKGVFESDQFDFKLMLPDPRDNGSKRRLRETVAAFANSGGGFLILGVDNSKDKGNEERLVGLNKSDDIPANFGNYASRCEPPVEWNFKNPPIEIEDGKLVHVI